MEAMVYFKLARRGYDNIDLRGKKKTGGWKVVEPPAPSKGRLFPLLARYKKGNKGWKRYGGTQDIRLSDTSYPPSAVHILRVQKTDVKTMP